MAQIIKNRRGSLERISAVSSSFQKGELIITSGSSNLTTTNGSSILFAATESGSVQAVNRFLIGTNAPNIFSSSIYNGLVKGVPYYASGSSTLYLLGSDQNSIPDLTGNITNFSASVAISISASIAASTFGNLVGKPAGLVSGSSQIVLNNADKTGFDTDDVSEGTRLYYTDARVKTKLNTETVVSGSSQITITSTTGFTDYSGSVSASLGALSASVGSGNVGISITNLYCEY